MPIRVCIPRLVRMMAIQQIAPRTMDFPLDLTIATRLVLSPIALMAMIMRNLESCLRGVKKLLDTPREVRRVVRRDAKIKYRIKSGKTFFSCKPCLFFCSRLCH